MVLLFSLPILVPFSLFAQHTLNDSLLRKALITYDNREISYEEMKAISPDSIQKIVVTNPADAEVLIGEKGANGIVSILSKSFMNGEVIYAPPITDAGKINDSIPKTEDSLFRIMDGDTVYLKPEVQAAFPGGDAAWRKYLERNLQPAPDRYGAPKGLYKAAVFFIVEKDGSVSKIWADPQNNPGYGTTEEAIRVIKKGPKWMPGNYNGKIVRSLKHMPIIFMVAD